MDFKKLTVWQLESYGAKPAALTSLENAEVETMEQLEARFATNLEGIPRLGPVGRSNIRAAYNACESDYYRNRWITNQDISSLLLTMIVLTFVLLRTSTSGKTYLDEFQVFAWVCQGMVSYQLGCARLMFGPGKVKTFFRLLLVIAVGVVVVQPQTRTPFQYLPNKPHEYYGIIAWTMYALVCYGLGSMSNTIGRTRHQSEPGKQKSIAMWVLTGLCERRSLRIHSALIGVCLSLAWFCEEKGFGSGEYERIVLFGAFVWFISLTSQATNIAADPVPEPQPSPPGPSPKSPWEWEAILKYVVNPVIVALMPPLSKLFSTLIGRP